MGLPLDPEKLLTKGGGQVLGLGKNLVQTILHRHGIERVLAAEGRRTSRNSQHIVGAKLDCVLGRGRLSTTANARGGCVRLHMGITQGAAGGARRAHRADRTSRQRLRVIQSRERRGVAASLLAGYLLGGGRGIRYIPAGVSFTPLASGSALFLTGRANSRI
jgi:hypothetical protein